MPWITDADFADAVPEDGRQFGTYWRSQHSLANGLPALAELPGDAAWPGTLVLVMTSPHAAVEEGREAAALTWFGRHNADALVPLAPGVLSGEVAVLDRGSPWQHLLLLGFADYEAAMGWLRADGPRTDVTLLKARVENLFLAVYTREA